MTRSIWILCTSGLALLAPGALAGKPERSRAPLVRPDPAPDPDAKGRSDLRAHKEGEDRCELRAQNLDPGLAYEAFVEDAVGAGTFTSVGLMVAGEEAGSFALKFDQKNGPLPLGAAGVEELFDREVQVQTGGQVHLSGWFMPFGESGGGKGGAWERARADLELPGAPPDADAKGRVEVRHKAKENRDRLTVKIERVDAATVTFSLWLDDGLGTLTDVGALSPSDDQEGARYRVDTKSGAPLPFGAASVFELGGRALEVRGDDGFTYLVGTVPEL